MKHLLFITLLFFIFIGTGLGQSSGQLDVSFSSSHAGGNYKPKNIVAVWVETSEGAFVKTLLAYANKRKTHLNTWQASTKAAGSEYNTVDAITGATKNSHATRSCSWDGMDFNGNSMPDGDYKLWMELTDKNSTGNYSSFDFSKGPDQQQLNPSDEPSFGSLAITWSPSTTSLIASTNDQYKNYVFPNPVSQTLRLSVPADRPYKIVNMQGQVIYSGNEAKLDFQDQANGLYFIIIEGEKALSFTKE